MELLEISPGFWRWTAPHPDWTPDRDRPGGWGQMVACLYDEPQDRPAASGPAWPTAGVVLIDPLAPPAGTEDAKRFWDALDRDLARAHGPVAILLGNHFHVRSAQGIFDRYRERLGASIWAHEGAVPNAACQVTHPFRTGQPLPGGVEAFSCPGLFEGEVVFFLRARRALVVADALIGAGGGRVRVAPPTWAPEGEEARARYRREFRPSIRRLLDLPFKSLLVSHGAPILEDGRACLEEALDAPAWGE